MQKIGRQIMDRKSFSSVLDEAVNRLDSEVRALKNRQAVITVNLKELEARRDKLSQEIYDAESKLSGVEKEYKDKVDKMLKTASDKIAMAAKKETESSDK